MNPLIHLIDYGQSFWLDNIRRGFTRAGSLSDLVVNDGLRGVTSNPTIFEKAVAESDDYDDAIRELAAAGKNPDQMYDVLTTDDIREACDVFSGVYHQTKGADGFVSIELPPHLANDTAGSIAEGLRLWPLVGRPNVMVKVPATDAGIPVVRSLIAEGVNVNITLMFGTGYYERVIDAYFSGLEDRQAKNLPLHGVASVASCFVSRVDTEADKRIEAAAANADDATKARLNALLGKTAIANSKRLYTLYLQSIESARWKKLAAAGAGKQRPLWASTSTKNPKYPDVYYVEALIGPDTVDTMPPATIDAFRDHGKLAARLESGMEEAEEQLQSLESLGISLKDITDKLLADGLVTFEKAYDQLIGVIDRKSKAIAAAGAQK
ncbi:MAG TPA: transaldolase [Candidatus Eremiobacteraceae bacterium]|nr:transaldolase [Candidatus Eremiobacteraceae bacterium]